MKTDRTVFHTTASFSFDIFTGGSNIENGRSGYIANFSEKLFAYSYHDVTQRQRISIGLVKHRVWRKGEERRIGAGGTR